MSPTFAACVAAEVRARMAARRISGKSLASRVGVSQNYLAIRLRDEKSFTLDDLGLIATELGCASAWGLIEAARRWDEPA